jgi:hypothetical protein
MEQYADKTLIANLDRNNYSDSELISIKIPVVDLPYYTNSKEFERVDGKIEIDGVVYNYVKRRLYNDTFELMCIPNKAANQFKTARDEFFSLVNDLQEPGHSANADHHKAVVKCANGAYCSDLLPFTIQGRTTVFLETTDHYLLQIPSVFLTRAGQPPEEA